MIIIRWIAKKITVRQVHKTINCNIDKTKIYKNFGPRRFSDNMDFFKKSQ